MPKKNLSPSDLPHVGGHCFVTHLDSGILEYAINVLKCKTMIDIGCGPGGMIDLAFSLGIDALGIDGDYRLKRSDNKIFIHDYTTGSPEITSFFDFAYSCEFVEHVEEKYISNYIKTFKLCKNILITFAPTGTPGYHHVNCKSEQYWIDVFESNNFTFDKTITDDFRTSSTMNRNFIREYGLYFKNNETWDNTTS
jgi:hypothetical protein